jgi:hypothetical protein
MLSKLFRRLRRQAKSPKKAAMTELVMNGRGYPELNETTNTASAIIAECGAEPE